VKHVVNSRRGRLPAGLLCAGALLAGLLGAELSPPWWACAPASAAGHILGLLACATAGLALLLPARARSRFAAEVLVLLAAFQLGAGHAVWRTSTWREAEAVVRSVAGEAFVKAEIVAAHENWCTCRLEQLAPLAGAHAVGAPPPSSGSGESGGSGRVGAQAAVHLVWRHACPAQARPRCGENWAGFVRLVPARGPRYPGDWDPRPWLARVRCAGWIVPRCLARCGLNPTPARPALGQRLADAATRARTGLGARIGAMLPATTAPLARALLLGRRAAGEGAERLAPLETAGAGHLFAVSGLHVGWFAAGTAFLLGLLPFDWRVRRLFLVPVALAFATVVGWTPAVTRAALGVGIWAGLTAAGRRPRALTIWTLLLAAQLWQAPGSWREPGVALSYLVTLALLGVFGSAPQRRLPAGAPRAPRRRARGGLALRAVVAAQATAWCILLAWRGGASPFYLAGNLLLVPAIGVLYPALALSLMIAGLPGFPAEIAAGPVDLGLRAVLAAGALCARISRATFISATVGPEAAMAVAAAIAALWHVRRGPRAAPFAAALALCLTVTGIGRHNAATPRLLLVDVGQGEAWLCLHRRGVWAIDCGPDERGWQGSGGARVLTACERLGARRLARLFLTHDDGDHSGGLGAWVAAGLPVACVHAPRGWSPSRLTRARLATLLVRGTRLSLLARGDSCCAPGVGLTVLHPPVPGEPGAPADPTRNATGLALRIHLAGLRLLVAGDAPSAVEATWLGLPGVAALDVLSAAHHGSDDGTPAALLTAARPTLVLISVGRNPYGHPGGALLGRLQAAGVRVLRTDRDGSVWLEPHRGTWRARALGSNRVVSLERRFLPAATTVAPGACAWAGEKPPPVEARSRTGTP